MICQINFIKKILLFFQIFSIILLTIISIIIPYLLIDYDFDTIHDILIKNSNSNYTNKNSHIFSFLIPTIFSYLPQDKNLFFITALKLLTFFYILKLFIEYYKDLNLSIIFFILFFLNNSIFPAFYSADDNIFQVPFILIVLIKMKNTKIDFKLGFLLSLLLSIHIQVLFFILFFIFLYKRKFQFLFGILFGYFILIVITCINKDLSYIISMFDNLKIYSQNPNWMLFANIHNLNFSLLNWIKNYFLSIIENLGYLKNIYFNLSIFLISTLLILKYYKIYTHYIILALICSIFPFIYEYSSYERWVTIYPIYFLIISSIISNQLKRNKFKLITSQFLFIFICFFTFFLLSKKTIELIEYCKIKSPNVFNISVMVNEINKSDLAIVYDGYRYSSLGIYTQKEIWMFDVSGKSLNNHILNSDKNKNWEQYLLSVNLNKVIVHDSFFPYINLVFKDKYSLINCYNSNNYYHKSNLFPIFNNKEDTYCYLKRNE
jgi:hypothetical protein